MAYNFVHKESSTTVIARTPLITIKIGPISLLINRFDWYFSFTRVDLQRAVESLLTSVARLLPLWLFGLASLCVVQFGCLYLVVGMCWFDDLLLVLYMNQIRVLLSLIIHNFSIIVARLFLVLLLDCGVRLLRIVGVGIGLQYILRWPRVRLFKYFQLFVVLGWIVWFIYFG